MNTKYTLHGTYMTIPKNTLVNLSDNGRRWTLGRGIGELSFEDPLNEQLDRMFPDTRKASK